MTAEIESEKLKTRHDKWGGHEMIFSCCIKNMKYFLPHFYKGMKSRENV
jgi:hypothetical protein